MAKKINGCQRSSRSPATRSVESEVCWSHFHRFAAQFCRPQREKKISGTQGSCKSDIFKLKFDQRSFVRLKSVLPCVLGTPQKCTKFCQQVVYSQNDTLSGNSHITKGNKSPGDMARNFNLRY